MANIQLEPQVKLKSSRGFIDFLLLNEKGFPFIVLEAKAEDKAVKDEERKIAAVLARVWGEEA